MEKKIVIKIIWIIVFACVFAPYPVKSQQKQVDYYILFEKTKEYDIKKMQFKNRIYFDYIYRGKGYFRAYFVSNIEEVKPIEIFPWEMKKYCFYFPFYLYEQFLKNEKELSLYLIEKDQNNTILRYKVSIYKIPDPIAPTFESTAKAEEPIQIKQ